MPLLQYALTELFERRSHELMTREAYEAIGGVLGALGRRAEEIYADLDEAWQTLTRQLFLRLVTLGEGVEDTRRRVLRSELEALDRDSNKVISAVLDDFGRARLLIFDRDPTNREATVEVAHEALLREWRRLRRWLDESRGDVRMQRLLAAATTEWQANDQEPGFLLRAARLDQFAGWAEANTVALTPDEKNFLAASVFARRERQEEEQQRRFRELRSAQALAESESQRAEIERKRAEEQARSTRKIRRTARLLAGLAVVAVLLAVGAFQLFRQAQQNEKLAASRELAAAALNNLEIDPGLSVLLALEAVDVADTREAQNALHQAVPAMHLLHTFVGHENFLQVMALSQDGRLLATGGPEQIKLWDVDSGEELLTLDTPSQAAKALAFSPDGHYLATGGYWLPDNIWKLEVEPTGTKLNAGKVLTLTGHSDAGMVADFSPDGRLLATGNNDATVRLWDAANGEEVAVLAGHEQKPAVLTTGLMGITDLEFSPDGLSLATAGTDGTVRLWEIPSAKELHVIPGSGRAFTKVDFSPDGDRLAATSEDGTIRVWDLATDPGMALPTMAITEDGIEAVQFSPDGQALAAGSRDGTAILRDASSGREMLALHGHTGSVRDLLFTPDGKRLLTIAEDKTARLWDISPDREIQTLSPGGWPAYSPDGAHLAIRGLDGRILIYDTNSGQVSLTISDQPVRGVIVYSLDGSLLATGRWDGTAKIWDSATGKELLAMEGHLDRVHALAFSPDGNYLATGDGLAGAGQASVRIWDTHLGQELLNLPATDWLVSAVEFSPDGEQVAAATWGIGGNHAIKVWDAHSGQLLHSQPVDLPYDLAYSPDGNMVAVALEQGNSILWDITGESWTEALVLTGHASSVGRVNFNHTGDQLVTASFDGTARVWDTTTGEELTNLAGHGDQVVMADFSPDGKRIVTLPCQILPASSPSIWTS